MIGDIVTKATVVFRGDVTDLKAKIKELSGEEKKAAEELLKQTERKNAALESNLKMWGRITAGVTAFGLAAKVGWDFYKHEAEKARLTTASLGIEIDRLNKAALGGKSQMALLADAAKMNNGIFKLTTAEMVNVERAMVGLSRKGHDYEEVNKKVLDAVTQLKDDGLKDLGIKIDKTGLDMETAEGRFGLVQRMLAALKTEAGLVGDEMLTMAEKVRRAQATMEDGENYMKGLVFNSAAIGSLAWRNQMKDDAFAAKKAGMSLDDYQNGIDVADKALKVQQKMAQETAAYVQRYPKGWLDTYMLGAGGGVLESSERGLSERKRGDYQGTVMSAIGSYSRGDTETIGGRSTSLGGALSGGDEFGRDIMGQIDLSEYGRDPLTTGRSYEEYQNSKLEAVFGPLQDFDLYKTAFDTLTGAVGGAFGAWIDGSMSAGAAFKKFIGEALKGVAVQMAMEALKHGAYAIGNLAFGNFAGAATHGKAAAAFAAGALVVGAAAKSLHGGGASTGSGASAPGGGVPAYSGNSQASGGTQTTVIAYGQDFANDSARQRQLRAARVVEDARQAGGNGAVSYA